MSTLLIITDQGSYLENQVEDPNIRMTIFSFLTRIAQKGAAYAGRIQFALDYYGHNMTHQQIADAYNVPISSVIEQINMVASHILKMKGVHE